MDFNTIAQRKPLYRVGDELMGYLERQGRLVPMEVNYAELKRFDGLMPHLDVHGKPTLWNSVLYRPGEREELYDRLVETYQTLIADGRQIGHLQVAGVDFCAYGNSQPFRIKILNRINDNHDYFYIKISDSSRVYGLELEHLLSPNRISYLVDGPTLVEEHIIGVPGDSFIVAPQLYGGQLNEVRLSKEFVKFNERCFVRLLGDMRAYNFVVDVIHDLDQVQYRIRSIDFDQQSHEGRARIYLPQFYKENLAYVQLAQRVIGAETAEQYRNEERALLRRRYKHSERVVEELLAVLEKDHISTAEQARELGEDLGKLHGTRAFAGLTNMGQVLRAQLSTCLQS
ncbi:MAG: hypothetical protein IPO05_15865 [Flavobacteriales bacterium]|jgi:hypothetical protein|nr:hypothetical protein [Flavobacteriales bacterium]MBK9515062.1 hypothetical protein [Flavobacteriales bacterium]MBP7449888.1 hypothetical protein [Flavobacteriales bacterium]HOZ40041.1 hypothetical protein [Flavobacteriales bacterium]